MDPTKAGEKKKKSHSLHERLQVVLFCFVLFFLYTLKLALVFLYSAHYNQCFPVSSLPGEVSHSFGSDRISTHVGCGASCLSWSTPKEKHGCSSLGGQQVAGETCSCVSLRAEGCGEQQEVLVNTFWTPFSSVLLLSTRIYMIHFTSIELSNGLQTNQPRAGGFPHGDVRYISLALKGDHGDTEPSTDISINLGAPLSPRASTVAHANTIEGHSLELLRAPGCRRVSREKVTYSRWTFRTPNVKGFHENTKDRIRAEGDAHAIITYLFKDPPCKNLPFIINQEQTMENVH